VAVLTGSPSKKRWKYRWDEGGDHAFRSVPETAARPLDSMYCPIDGAGGTVICRLDQEARDRSQFGHLRLLPRDWGRYVYPAWGRLQQNRLLFVDLPTGQNRQRLTDMLTDQNPLLAAEACRALAESAALPDDLFTDVLPAERGCRQAVMTLLVLESVPEGKSDETFAALAKIIDEARGPEHVQGIGLAALAAIYDTSRPPSQYSTALRLLETLRRRAPALKGDADAGRYLRSILEFTGRDEGDAEAAVRDARGGATPGRSGIRTPEDTGAARDPADDGDPNRPVPDDDTGAGARGGTTQPRRPSP
jgi:hypothetical protein